MANFKYSTTMTKRTKYEQHCLNSTNSCPTNFD